MAEYMESNVTLIRNLIEDNKTYKHVSEILRQNFPEVTRGFSERNVRLFCAKCGIRRTERIQRGFHPLEVKKGTHAWSVYRSLGAPTVA